MCVTLDSFRLPCTKLCSLTFILFICYISAFSLCLLGVKRFRIFALIAENVKKPRCYSRNHFLWILCFFDILFNFIKILEFISTCKLGYLQSSQCSIYRSTSISLIISCVHTIMTKQLSVYLSIYLFIHKDMIKQIKFDYMRLILTLNY